MQIIEWIGVLSGIAAVYLLYKNSILTWITGYLNILCFMIIFWVNKLYGDFIVQIIFLIVGIWGWINWYKSKITIPQKLNTKNNLLFVFFTLIFWFVGFYLFNSFTKCSFPVAESLILALSITGQILTALRKIENWYYWIIADTLMTLVYLMKELYPTSVYSFTILIIGFLGLIRWKKLIKANNL
ncbi:MAG: nicotinamide mononucleotide transporter [Bacteroidetes bacterium]|nr:nicotinamide mononucleotide transporter [Bacteroidota bacterium]